MVRIAVEGLKYKFRKYLSVSIALERCVTKIKSNNQNALLFLAMRTDCAAVSENQTATNQSTVWHLVQNNTHILLEKRQCHKPSGLRKHCLPVQGFAFQCLSSRLGIATGLNLAQHCGKEYPRLPRYLMWICMEIAIIGADIQEVIGSAIAIALLSNNVIPLWAGKKAQP